MTGPILRKVFADLTGHSMQSALVLVLLIAASATLALSLLVWRAADDAWQRAFDASRGAHITFVTGDLREGQSAADLERIAALEGVVEAAGPYPGVLGRFMLHDGDKYQLELIGAAQPTELSRPLISSGTWIGDDPDAIVLDLQFARGLGIEVGDTVTILGEESPLSLTVTGLAVNAWRGPYPEWPPIAFMQPDALARVEPDRSAWARALLVRIAEPAETFAFVERARALEPGALLMVDLWQDARDDVASWNQINAVFLGVFSIFALLAVGLIVANMIAGRVLAQYRDIGLLKAIGYTPRQVMSVYVLEHVLLAFAASLAGLAAGYLIAPLFLNRMAEALNTTAGARFDPMVTLAVPLSVTLLVTLFTVLPAWRGGRVPTARAIAIAAVPPRTGASRLAAVARGLRLPAPVVLGVKDAFSRPGRALVTVIALSLTVVTVVFALSVSATIDKMVSNPALQGDPFTHTVVVGDVPTDEARAIIAAQPGIEFYFTRTLSMAEAGSGPLTQRFSIRALSGDYQHAAYIVPDGRMFNQPGEAVAGRGLLQALGLRVGDRLTLSVRGHDEPVTVTIVGRYLEEEDSGRVLMTSLETLGDKAPEGSLTTFAVKAAADTSWDALQTRLLQASGYEFDVWTVPEEAPAEVSAMRYVGGGLSVVLLVIGLANLLATTIMNVRERTRDFGIFKAIGLTPRQVVVSVVANVGLLALLAALIGIPIGLINARLLFTVVGENMMDVQPELYAAPPAWLLALVIPSAVLVAVIRSAIPARQAAGIQVARAVRHQS